MHRQTRELIAHIALTLSRQLGSRSIGQWLLIGLSVVGYLLALTTLLPVMLKQVGLAYDAHSYWLAGQRILSGSDMYRAEAINSLDAYRYPPLFAHLWAPLAQLPEVWFTTAWRLICFGSLYYLAGSWRNVGLWLLFAPTLHELNAANVTFPVAALSFMALQGRPQSIWAAAALKYGPGLLAPYLWWTRRSSRRPLVIGAIVTLAACGVSAVLAPQAWVDYLHSLTDQAGGTNGAEGLVSILPSTFMDFALRTALAVGLVYIAWRQRNDNLAYVASMITVPTLWTARFCVLLAAFRLRKDRNPEWVVLTVVGLACIDRAFTTAPIDLAMPIGVLGIALYFGAQLLPDRLPSNTTDGAGPA